MPPASSKADFNTAVRTSVFPRTTSSIWVYGHAVASPQLNAHQIVNRNRHTPYTDTPKLSATEMNM